MESLDWSPVRAFVTAAEKGSFTAAAAELGVAQPTVGRQVAALEQSLDLVLFERVGRGLRLTAAGEALLEPARAMRTAAMRLSLRAVAQTEEPVGRVCISSSDIVAHQLLAPVVASLVDSYPEIAIELVTTNEISDLVERDADIALRHVRPVQPELIGRRLRDGSAGMYATRDYLGQLGRVEGLSDLRSARFIAFDRSERMVEHLRGCGLEVSQSHFPVATASSLVQVELARQGVGICFLSRLLAVGHPDLHPVLPERLQLPVPIWLVCHRELRTTPRFRVVYDAIATHLG